MFAEKIIQEQERCISNAAKWLNSVPARYGTAGEIGHNLFLMKEDKELVGALLEKHGYVESYCEFNESGNFEGYTMWLTYYKNILLNESEILNSLQEILTVLNPYSFMYVDSFFLMTEKGEYFNALGD